MPSLIRNKFDYLKFIVGYLRRANIETCCGYFIAETRHVVIKTSHLFLDLMDYDGSVCSVFSDEDMHSMHTRVYFYFHSTKLNFRDYYSGPDDSDVDVVSEDVNNAITFPTAEEILHLFKLKKDYPALRQFYIISVQNILRIDLPPSHSSYKAEMSSRFANENDFEDEIASTVNSFAKDINSSNFKMSFKTLFSIYKDCIEDIKENFDIGKLFKFSLYHFDKFDKEDLSIDYNFLENHVKVTLP